MMQTHLNNTTTSAADSSLFPPPLFLNQCLNKDCLINAAGKPTTITSTLLGDDDKEQRGTSPPYLVIKACAAMPSLCGIYINTKTNKREKVPSYF